MNQFILQQGHSRELSAFPYILELAFRKNTSIQLNSLHASSTKSLRIYSIVEGKFEWIINERNHILYPGDVALILPGQTFRGEKDVLNIGTLSWINLDAEINANGMSLGKWSSLSKNECITIGRILTLSNTNIIKLKDCYTILQTMRDELLTQEIGFASRVNGLTDQLFIAIARQCTRQNNLQRDFPQSCIKN